MICKERDPGEHPENDKFAVAGAKAEKQMAFYLRRAFVDADDLWVFNDIRLKDDTDDRAQVDHLILHRHGFIIIESKSVSTGVSVNQHGEWVRFWNNRPQGMASPIGQARRQIEFLRRMLQANREELLGKALGIMQKGFRNCPFEILVSISDDGTIKREIELPEVVKADQVTDRIREIVKRHKKAASLFSKMEWNSMDGVYNFSDEEVARISSFLLEHHCPLSAVSYANTAAAVKVCEPHANYSVSPAPVAEQELVSAASPAVESGLGICDKCGEQCLIKWGRYGYYWKCVRCDSNMAIKEFCSSCNQKIKLRKERNRFFSYCDLCKTPEHLYCEFE